MGIEVAALALAAGSAYAGNEARLEQRKASRARENIRRRQESRQKISQLRQTQIARARTLQAGANSGVLDSSGSRGVVSSMQSTFAGNLAFQNQISGMQDQVASRMESANKMQGMSQTLGALSSMTMTAGSIYKNYYGGANTPVSMQNNTSSTNASYLAGGGALA